MLLSDSAAEGLGVEAILRPRPCLWQTLPKTIMKSRPGADAATRPQRKLPQKRSERALPFLQRLA